MFADIYHDELEQKQHEEAIKSICQQYPEQKEFIRQSYLETLTPLSSEARIRSYLPIIVTRQILDLLARH